MRDRLVIFILVLLGVVAVGYAIPSIIKSSRSLQASTESQPLSTTTVTINDHQLTVELAVTADQQAQGLSGRDSLATNTGMLFVFTPPAQVPFWMKDMKFPLDFVWIKDGTIVQIDRKIAPSATGTPTDQLPLITPNQPVDDVLEINANAADSFAIGDKVLIAQNTSS